MAGEIPSAFSRFVVQEQGEEQDEEPGENEDENCKIIDFAELVPTIVDSNLNLNENDTVEELDSVDNESLAGNYNTASEVCLDDTISSSGVPIDPGNFSESDIEEDASNSYAPSNTLDPFGGFPESDIEDEPEDDSMSEIGSASVSFNSDLGSPMHSSCRSYAVSEDKEDEREEATPLPFCSSIGADELNPVNRRTSNCKACNVSEKGANKTSPSGKKITRSGKEKSNSVGGAQTSQRELRSSARRKLLRLQITQQRRMLSKQARKGKTKPKEVSAVAGCSSSQTPRMPILAPFDADDEANGHDGSTTRSLCIPILDLCITEDEGYLGMGEDKSEGSEKDLPMAQGHGENNDAEAEG